MHTIARLGLVTLALSISLSAVHGSIEISFEDRVDAQRSIERVYHEHRQGTRRSFEEAAPQALLEQRVNDYLRMTNALERLWSTKVTAELLDRELDRIAERTLMPGRLEEIFRALNNDPLLVRECLVRPALVNRLVRSYFSRDERIHGRDLEQAVPWGPWWSANAESFSGVEVQVEASEAPLPTFSRLDRGPTEGACGVTDVWDNGSLDNALDLRADHSAIWTGSEMIVWGGSDSNTGDRYGPVLDSWTHMTVIGAPTARNEHSAIWTGSEMIVWGGVGGGGDLLNSGGSYDPVIDSWVATATLLAPTARKETTVLWTGSEMIVWGGRDASGVTASGARFDPTTNSWATMSSAGAPVARALHTAVWTGSVMLVWGGNTFATGGLGDGASYNAGTDSWSPISATNAPPPTSDHTAVWTGSRMLIWDNTTSLGGQYSPAANGWLAISSVNAPAGDDRHSAVWTGTEMLVWGQDIMSTATGARFNPLTNTWTPISTMNAPPFAVEHTAVWTSTEMIAWGGRTNEGARYNPSTDSWIGTSILDSGPVAGPTFWTGNRLVSWAGEGQVYDPALDTRSPISAINAPSAGAGFAGVWSGDELLIWGAATTSNTPGRRYNPVTDSWTSMSTVGATDASVNDAASVWIGDEMFVWGSGFQFTTTGARYNPATDSWRATSTVGAPDARIFPGIVWSGSEVIIWGGFNVDNNNAGQYLGTGARYDPMTDSWHATSLVNAPSGRVDHSAVWDGSRLFVWGGQSPNAVTNSSGGLYNPLTDSWTPTNLVGAPSNRTRQSAILVGGEIIVWGGRAFDAVVGPTGGRYDILADSWLPTSTLDAPSARAGHAAVWTGEQMIVWGGQFTGGRYRLGDAIDDDLDGLSECAGDCNDATAAIFPGATETCDGLDNDCDGAVDDLDLDLDGFGACASDCDDTDTGVHNVPTEIGNLLFVDKATLTWDSAASAAGSGTSHDIASGLTSEFPVGGGVSESCSTVAPGANVTTIVALPASGEVSWYLVRGRNSCGSSPYGNARSTASCP